MNDYEEKRLQEMKADFFITYHHNDELAARWIAGVLKEVPFSILMESWDFLQGKKPIEKIEHMTSISRCALMLLSERFLQAGMDAESWQAVAETFDSKAVILLRIDSCEVEKVLGAVTYTNLFGMNEAEARKRLLTAVGAPTADKREPVTLLVTAMTRDEVLEKRKAELDELLNTTIKHQYHMKLDLEQEVEKEIEVMNEKTWEMEKRKEWVWEQVLLETVLTDKNNYILVNPSGMGKTTFLNYAACVLLDRAGDYPFVPLFTTCITLNNREGSVENFIHQWVESFYNNSQTAIVQGEWENLCILLDALDQARDVDDIVVSLQIHDKYHYYKKAKIILSSRQNTADKVKAGFKKIRLKLPEDDEVKHYLGEENYKKLEGHIAASRELVTVPVLLEMLKTITEKGYKASKLWNRADLYTEFTRILVDQERSKPRFWQDTLSIRHFIDNELEHALEKIAFFSLADNRILEIEKEKLVKYCETSEKKEALLNIGIILELFEDREQKIVFRHQSFQAYFAARYMFFRQPELFKRLIGDIGFFYNDVWYEVMRFFVCLEKDLKKAETIIDAIYQTEDKNNNLEQALRLIFAVCLVSEVRVSIKKIQILHEGLGVLLTNNKQYLNFFFSNIYKFNTSNDEQQENLFITFVRLLLDDDWSVRNIAAEVLGKIGTANDIPFLEPLLRYDDRSVRNTAAEVLGKIGTTNGNPLLETLINLKECLEITTADEALGKIHTTNDIPLLELRLRYKHDRVRQAAAEALGKIGTAKEVPLLKRLLRDQYNWVRNAASKAIEQIYKRATPEVRIDDVLPQSEEKEALFVKTAATQPLHILHISDIHYALEKDSTITCIFHEFLQDIQKWRTQQNNQKIHSICLTGDIAQSGQKNQYESINEKINAILNTTCCSKEHLFIIPGNHDVQEYHKISDKNKTTLKEVRENKMGIDNEVLNNFENYREFHEKFINYYEFVEISGYVNSIPITDKRSGIPKPWYSRKLQDFPVRIIGLNSALFCLKEFSEYGKIRMGTNQFHEAYFQGKPGNIPKGELVILLTHHPVNWLAENEYENYTTLMERYGIIHLHGHIHRTKIRKLFSIAGSSYISVGTGSLYGEKGLGDINTYHIITLDFKKEEVHIWARRWIPERGCWGVYDNDINNTFPFPGKHH